MGHLSTHLPHLPHPMDWEFQSALPGAVWPAIPGGDTTDRFALLHQLESSQWLPPDRLLRNQLRQLEVLLKHAHATVPYYRERWGKAFDPALAVTPERLAMLPLLTRRDLQAHFDGLKSQAIPAAHGATSEILTTGSTATPVRVLKTRLVFLMWDGFTLRDHRWHRRDMRGKLAAIRYLGTEGEFDDWGRSTRGLITTGPAAVRGIDHDVESQMRWLEQYQPDYLLTYPSLLAELAKHSIARGIRLPRLREARAFGEMLTPQVRRLCRQAWAVPVTDMYSTSEVGHIALQCPVHEHYHVQSEDVLVEILDEHGAPCSPGRIGRVVVTTLHNFAMPLVRYDIGDYAEPGEACDCGRGLPVLRRVAGRMRNMLVTAAGERYWPSIGSQVIPRLAPILQYQLVQKSLDLVQARLVTAAPLSSDQEGRLRAHFLTQLPPGFRVELVYCESIPRGAGGKFEDFVSEIAATPAAEPD